MVHETVAATNAVVTLDVGLPGIVWGWIITMNMWAKSMVPVLSSCFSTF